MSNRPRPGEVYKHFKGNIYRIVTLAKHSETGEELVIYQALYGDFQVYARPLSMFMEPVDTNKYPDAVQEYRFEKQQELIMASLENKSIAETETTRKRATAGELAGAAAEETAAGATEEGPAATAAGATEEGPAATAAGATEEATAETGATEENVTETTTETEETIEIDPLVLEFLDAGTYEERLNILSALHHRITDQMITTMALSIDVEVEDGDVEERYEELKNCLLTYEKYEGSRLR